MKTSDVLNIGFARVYGNGEFSSRSDEIDPRTGNVVNKRKMSQDKDTYFIHDFIKFDQYPSSCSALESELKLVAFNERFYITIELSTPLNELAKTDLAIFTEINGISRDGNSCTSFYDPEKNCIETRAYITFVGYGMFLEHEEGRNQNEEITFSSSPEIEGFMNLMLQVINRAYAVTKSVEDVLSKS